MKRYKILTAVFLLSAVSLSHLMCAVVAYSYCALQWGGRYAGWSAPPGTAFLYVGPYGVGVALCLFLAAFFHKKSV